MSAAGSQLAPSTQDDEGYDPFAGGQIERVIPTTEAQREVWLADRLGAEASLAFNESITLHLRGSLDAVALTAAIARLLERHELLRATVSPDGASLVVMQQIDVPLAQVDSMSAGLDPIAALSEAAAAAVAIPFDLERGPLLRAQLHRLAPAHHALLLTAHHLVCDGWSWAVLARDLGALYAELLGEAPAPDAPTPYADYVRWEQDLASSPEAAEHERYWLSRFSGSALPVLELPTDHPRPAVRRFESRRIDRLWDVGLLEDIRRCGAAHGASLVATLFAGFCATLARITTQDEVVVGVPAAGQAASGLFEVVGHCVNLLPVRVPTPRGAPFSELLRAAATQLLDAYEHQALGYGSLLKKLPVQRDPSRLPLASVMFNVDQALDGRKLGFPALQVDLVGNPRCRENFELFINAVQIDGGLRIECQYGTSLFDAESIERWLDSWEVLMRAAVATPGAAVDGLDWLGPVEWEAQRALQPLPSPLPVPALMHRPFELSAASAPDRIALIDGDAKLSYRAVDAAANRLARRLRQQGVGRGDRVGLCLPRGADMVVSLLGVLKAGAAYVPLDPGFPKARLDYYAQDAGLAVMLTLSTVAVAPRAWRADAADRVIELDRDAALSTQPEQPLEDGPMSAQANDAAYVIYTSGSTGQPKGVVVPHRAVANFLVSMCEAPGLRQDDVFAAVTTLSFDIAVLELLLPLAVGAQVLLVPRETAMDGLALLELLRVHGATAMQATPGQWRILIDAGWDGSPRLAALVGGEALPADLAAALLQRSAAVWNLYGPTETTIWSTLWRVERSALVQRGVSIGRPIANTEVWILDEHLQPCPRGVPGEICIAGAGLALGYHGRPGLTAERFVDSAVGRVYRTGDRGRWRHDGLLEHLGRLDFQVKLRGYRIELGEIESVAIGAGNAAQAVVVAKEFAAADVRLVAYLVAASGRSVDVEQVRARWRERLPDYMQPQHVVTLDTLPLLPNGKVDRRALPVPEMAPAVGGSRREAANGLERTVLEHFEAVLNLPGLGVDDNFFALGGHSLLAARLTTRLNRAFDLQLPLVTLFSAPTAAQLAAEIGKRCGDNGNADVPRLTPDPSADRRRGPLTAMQRRVCFVQALHPERVLYNTPSAHRLRGPFDPAAFERALREVMRRQPVLRTRIDLSQGVEAAEQVVEDDVVLNLPVIDLSERGPAEREAELMRRMQDVIDTPMPLDRAPLFRAGLYRLAPGEHVFFFMPHHVIWDGWSFDVLYDELSSLYAAHSSGRPPARAALPLDYLDYARWLERWQRSPACERQLAFWRERFVTSPEVSSLPTEHPRQPGMTGRGATQWVRVSQGLTERLRVIAQATDATLNMLAMTVYAAALADLDDRQAIVLGMPVRGRADPQLEPLMGFFNNLLPLHVQVDTDRSARRELAELKLSLLPVLAHQDVPFEQVAALPEVAAKTQGVGLYQALFSFQDARERQRRWGTLDHEAVLVFQKGATEDLGLWLMEVPAGLEGGITYNAELYTDGWAIALRDRFVELLERVASAPDVPLTTLLHEPSAPRDALRQRLASAAAQSASAADHEGPATAATVGDAMNEAERVLAEIWSEVLSLPITAIRATDNFFDLGGDSLLAMRAIERTRSRLGQRVEPRRYVFESLAQLVATPSDAPAAQAATPERPRGLMAGVLSVFGRKPGRR